MFDLLVVDDTPNVRRRLVDTFARRLSGYRVREAGDKAEALRELSRAPVGLVLLDLAMPSSAGAGDDSYEVGAQLLAAIRHNWPRTRVIVVTSEEERAREFLVEQGADDFFAKPELRGPGLYKLVGEVEHLLGHFPCRSERGKESWETLQGLTPADPVTVLVGGPGTGKHMVAAWLHREWAALDSDVVETPVSVLAGLRSAEVRSRLTEPGVGTVVLSGMERLQSLTEKTQQALGSVLADASAGPRFVLLAEQPTPGFGGAAGAASALRMILESAPTVFLAGLRERMDDVVELAETCCRAHARGLRKAARQLEPTAAEVLLAYAQQAPWRSNLADLGALMEASVARSSGNVVTVEDLELQDVREDPALLSYTVVSLDVVGSTEIKRGQDRAAIQATFDAFHRWVERMAAHYHGEVYVQAGDGVLLRFPVADEAASCAQQLVEGLDGFNTDHNQLDRQVEIRLGIQTGDLPEVSPGERGRVSSPTLDDAAKLQQHARPGEILLSKATYSLLTDGSGFRSLRAPVFGIEAYSG